MSKPIFKSLKALEALSDKELREEDSQSANDELAIRQARRLMRGHKTHELKETLSSMEHQDNLSRTDWLIIRALEREIEDRRAFYVATHAPKVGFSLENVPTWPRHFSGYSPVSQL